mmetsp:Transcript_63338/g.136203  ORF Transcript_63338/g.136203 Transcript_63338/m.136203 type:complete len:217 (+) Transcript_63338:56-706(+)
MWRPSRPTAQEPRHLSVGEVSGSMPCEDDSGEHHLPRAIDSSEGALHDMLLPLPIQASFLGSGSPALEKAVKERLGGCVEGLVHGVHELPTTLLFRLIGPRCGDIASPSRETLGPECLFLVVDHSESARHVRPLHIPEADAGPGHTMPRGERGGKQTKALEAELLLHRQDGPFAAFRLSLLGQPLTIALLQEPPLLFVISLSIDHRIGPRAEAFCL